eukprot:TRINITY_DN4326_c0_g2_i4.p2 TRINITY_DN4326_c0_g2~~TRINITY_DN4326_c0_g2_i4.p2  ORF type:complete len:312 (-),score=25.13 TRINITY_DN4326_c0_g2_i4:639-1574(-)
MVKKTYADYVTEIETDCEHLVCVKLAKTLFGADSDVILVNCYCPPATSPYYRTANKQQGGISVVRQGIQTKCHIDSIEVCLVNLLLENDSHNIFICGDFNARTGTFQPNPENFGLDHERLMDFDSDVLTPCRCAEDKCVNDFGKALLSMCTCLELLILNGICTPEQSHKCTCLSTTGNSTNDYFLVSPDFLHYCNALEIQERVESNHMPLKLTLIIQQNVQEKIGDRDYTPVTKYVWDTAKRDRLVENMESPSFKNSLVLATSQIESSCDEALNTFTNVILDSASCMRKYLYRSKTNNKGEYQWYQWYDKE